MLTDSAIRAAKPSDKPQRLWDEKGLLLLIKPSGSRLWHFRYRFQNKENTLGFGIYPDVSLKEAREECDEARRDLRRGIDPAVKRKAEQRSPANIFEAVAQELLAMLRKASLAGENPAPAAAEVIERTI